MTIKKIKKSVLAKETPNWYRNLRILVYSVLVTSIFTGTLQRFGVTAEDVTLVSGWIITITEAIGQMVGVVPIKEN